MQRNSLHLSILSFIVLALNSCDFGNEVGDNFGQRHFPLDIGHFVVYDMNWIIHNATPDDEFESYQRMEVVADTFTNLAGGISYRIEQFRRDNPAERWGIDSVWSVRVNDGRIIKVENNEPFIKLVLPTRLGLEWDGNAINDFPRQTYRADIPLSGFRLRGENFENAIRIIQAQDSSLVNRNVRSEVYAEDIGMIYRRIESYNYIDDSTSPFFAQDSITGGVFLEQIMVEYGKMGM